MYTFSSIKKLFYHLNGLGLGIDVCFLTAPKDIQEVEKFAAESHGWGSCRSCY
jgi:hypothetical protein